jgi:hypothetical protein
MKYRRNAAWLLATCTITVACGTNSPEASSDNSEAFWSALRIDGAETEHYDSVGQMAKASDAVFVGRLGEPSRVRVIQGDAPEDQVFMGQLSIALNGDKIDGRPAAIIEFLLPSSSFDDAEHLMEHLVADAPASDVAVFARLKVGEGDGADLYRAVNSNGIWVEDDGKLSAPLSGDTDLDPGGAESVRGLVESAMSGSDDIPVYGLRT